MTGTNYESLNVAFWDAQRKHYRLYCRHRLKGGRHVWLQVLRGDVTLNGTELKTSDGAAVSDEQNLKIVADTAAEIMLFDLP